MKVKLNKDSIHITEIETPELKEALLNEIRITYKLYRGFPYYGVLPESWRKDHAKDL